MKVRAYGINTQNRSMYPCYPEVSQTVAICHHVATITYGLKYKQSAKSQQPYSKDIAQALSAGCHDASVVTYGIKYLASEKSQQPYSKDIAQALSAGCHDASVVMGIESNGK